MRKIILIAVFLAFISGIASNIIAQKENISYGKKKVSHKNIKSVFDKYGMEGCIIAADLVKGETHYYDNKRCTQKYIPASTFKIANLLIGLETGNIDSETIFKWDSVPRRLDVWNRDLGIYDAFKVSCVPCFQDLARRIGNEKMKEYLAKFRYDGMEFDESNIDMFWLQGQSKINAISQMEFVKKIYMDKLPIQKKNKAILFKAMEDEKGKNYTLYGKTGTAEIPKSKLTKKGNDAEEIFLLWYVGFLEIPGNVYFFAINMNSKKDTPLQELYTVRKQIVKEALTKMKILPE
ncbi:MAG: hypothetical protein A2X64_08020 [Ignavibacteria bacterium GWF2_33_9]|nr:MAG: hypothetical protein A2X64_08020 [Ignavibacteria bacterium GWF2_33_9]